MLHVGFADTDIASKVGSEDSGGMRAGHLDSVPDPLESVAMVIQARTETVIHLGIDAIFAEARAVERAGKRSIAAHPVACEVVSGGTSGILESLPGGVHAVGYCHLVDPALDHLR